MLDIPVASLNFACHALVVVLKRSVKVCCDCYVIFYVYGLRAIVVPTPYDEQFECVCSWNGETNLPHE